MTSILVTGGARSGKSRFAQQLAADWGKEVLFVATAEAGDEEMRLRIEEHRRSRPGDWTTLEATRNIGEEIARQIGDARLVIIDCITMLVSNILGQVDCALAESAVTAEINRLIESIKSLDADFIMVTNEVGDGLVPDNETARLYRDLLGKANQLLAGQAEQVYLMVAGLPLRLKPAT